MRKSRDYLQPSALGSGDIADFTGNLGKILILTEDHSDIQVPVTCHPHHIQAEP